MLKRLWTLIKNMFGDSLTKAEASYDKNRKPTVILQEAIARLKEEKNNVKHQYIAVDEKYQKSKSVIEDFQNRRKDELQKAREFKSSGNKVAAESSLRSVVKIDEWLDRYKVNDERMTNYKEQLKILNDDLRMKLKDYELELDLIESSQEMAQGTLERYDGIGVDMANIDDVLKDAHDRIARMNDSIIARENASEALDDKPAKQPVESSARVKELYNSI